MRKLIYSDVCHVSSGTSITSPDCDAISLEEFEVRLHGVYFLYLEEKRIYTKVIHNLIKYFQDTADVEMTIGMNKIELNFKKYVSSWMPFYKTLETVKYLEINYEEVSFDGDFGISRYPSWEIRFNRKGKRDFYARNVINVYNGGEVETKLDFDRLSSKEKEMIREVADNIKKTYRPQSLDFILEPYDSVKSFKASDFSNSLP